MTDFKPVIYSSGRVPKLKFFWPDGQRREFHNGIFTCETQEDAEMMEKAVADMSPSGRALIKKLDISGADAMIREQRSKKQKVGASGSMHSLSVPYNIAPEYKALADKLQGTHGIDEFMATHAVETPNVVPAKQSDVGVESFTFPKVSEKK